MRVLIVSDIHANWHALNAIDEAFDHCLFVGDLVDYGPNPQPCIDWVRENADYSVRGNHDHGFAQRVQVDGDAGYRRLSAYTRLNSYPLVRENSRRYLAELPSTQYLRIDDKVILLVHGTPRDPLDEYVFNNPTAWQKRLENVGADFVFVGHTHQQFQINLGATTVVNPGSVGQPRDGDPRASYAILENGNVELKRVEYDVEATIQELARFEMPKEVLAYGSHVLRNGGQQPAAPPSSKPNGNGESS